MSDEITRQTYWTEIGALAREAWRASEGDEERAREWITETIDGHEWVIYDGHALDVLQHTDNEAAGEDFGDLGEVVKERGVRGLLAFLAFAAMEADTLQELAQLIARDEDTEIDGCAAGEVEP